MSRLTIEIERLRAQHKSDKQFLATMVKAWDLIEEDQDREIERLKFRVSLLQKRIAEQDEDAEARAEADQAQAMAKAENDEWREREMEMTINDYWRF